MRFTGSGGQGVILASVIIAEAAILAGMNTVQSQAYGPEARGGMCKAETVISSQPIWFSKVQSPNMLLALTQKSLDKYSSNLADNAVVIIDSSLIIPASIEGRKVIAMPILDTATKTVGKAMTANIVAVGAINQILGLFDNDLLFEAVKRHVPAGTEELNEKALFCGVELANKMIQE